MQKNVGNCIRYGENIAYERKRKVPVESMLMLLSLKEHLKRVQQFRSY